MKKLFLSLMLLLPISLNAMDNQKRLLISGSSALAVGMGGHLLARKLDFLSECWLHANKIENDEKFNDVKGELTRENELAKKRYLKRAVGIGSLRFTAYLSEGLLAQYAFSGNLPTNTMQSYASMLAIAIGGGIHGYAVAKRDLDKRENKGRNARRYMACMASGLTLAGIGAYGLYKNS